MNLVKRVTMVLSFKEKERALCSLVATKGFRVKSHLKLIFSALPVLASGWFGLLELTMYWPYESDRVMSTSAWGSPRNQDCLEKATWSQTLWGQRHPGIFICLHDVPLITTVSQEDPCLAWVIKWDSSVRHTHKKAWCNSYFLYLIVLLNALVSWLGINVIKPKHLQIR